MLKDLRIFEKHAITGELYPLATNAAFATEMYFKCLLRLDGRDNFEDECKRTRDAFEHARYWYERPPSEFPSQGVIITLRNVILARQPDWRGLERVYFRPVHLTKDMEGLLKIFGNSKQGQG